MFKFENFNVESFLSLKIHPGRTKIAKILHSPFQQTASIFNSWKAKNYYLTKNNFFAWKVLIDWAKYRMDVAEKAWWGLATKGWNLMKFSLENKSGEIIAYHSICYLFFKNNSFLFCLQCCHHSLFLLSRQKNLIFPSFLYIESPINPPFLYSPGPPNFSKQTPPLSFYFCLWLPPTCS